MAAAYTKGEVRALIAPLFGQDPENLAGWTVVCTTRDGATLYADSETPSRADVQLPQTPLSDVIVARGLSAHIFAILHELAENARGQGEAGQQ